MLVLEVVQLLEDVAVAVRQALEIESRSELIRLSRAQEILAADVHSLA